MKPYSYDIQNTPARSKYTRLIVIVLIVAVAILTILIIRDLIKTPVDNPASLVQSSEIKSRLSTFVDHKEADFIAKLPEDWQKVAKPEMIINAVRFYPYRFQGIEGENIGRSLDIYIKDIPGNLAVSKIMPITMSQNNALMQAGEISPQCYKFTKFPKGRQGESYSTKWLGKKFMCDTSVNVNTVAAISDNLASGVVMQKGSHILKVLLVYTDHGSAENNSIFKDIVNGFRLK